MISLPRSTRALPRVVQKDAVESKYGAVYFGGVEEGFVRKLRH